MLADEWDTPLTHAFDQAVDAALDMMQPATAPAPLPVPIAAPPTPAAPVHANPAVTPVAKPAAAHPGLESGPRVHADLTPAEASACLQRVLETCSPAARITITVMDPEARS